MAVLPSYTAIDAAYVAQKAPGAGQVEWLRRIYEYFVAVNNAGGTAVTLTPVVRTAAFSTVTAGGTVAAGAKQVSFFNSGTTAATVAGGSLPQGQGVTFNTQGSDTLSAITYVASATAILQIATVV